jgi:hypothetical protein
MSKIGCGSISHKEVDIERSNTSSIIFHVDFDLSKFQCVYSTHLYAHQVLHSTKKIGPRKGVVLGGEVHHIF